MNSDDIIPRLLIALGYERSVGFIRVGDLPRITRHRHAFAEAFHDFNVVGVFGLTERDAESAVGANFVPLVYVAQAESAEEAQEIHRATWSQGIAPFLIIASRKEIWSCNGLSYISRKWEQGVHRFDTKILSSGTPLPDELAHLTARTLRTSLTWADREMGFDGRVDMRLLDNLRSLTTGLINGSFKTPPLQTEVANALVGRFLYLRFLRDRRIVPAQWLPLFNASSAYRIPGDSMLRGMWASFEKLERVFNGSIFPIPPESRSTITSDHAALLANVLLDEADITSSGMQSSFRDFRFSSIRTETLSAVYELFLEISNNDSIRNDGAVYTPPFLVDYVLSRLERDGDPLRSDDRVLDCAAGSGVFLVGAFRRIVETELAGVIKDTLPLSTLHKLLRHNIWGIERNRDACHVAAFSLYLTLLDYLDKEELNQVIALEGKKKVFPSMVGWNILPRDFFSRAALPNAFPKKFEVCVANPPWQKASDLQGDVLEYLKGPRSLSTDHGRAASLFFWKCIDEHLGPKGRFGFVTSGRSLISSGANRFPASLIKEVGLTTIVNLSHMRRKLFPRAEHPTVLLLGVKSPEQTNKSIQLFSPLLSSQPVASDGTPWTIIEDRQEIVSFRRESLKNSSALIEAMTLRPIDLELLNWLRDSCHLDQLMTLDDVLKQHNLEIKRGGHFGETGVPPEFTLGSDDKKTNYYRSVLGLCGNTLLPENHYRIPHQVLEKTKDSYKAAFGGNVIAVPRSMTHIEFIKQPFAFNSSINAIYSCESDPKVAPLLQAIALYLSSGFAKYCLTLIGRDWSLDERRLEQKELRKLPMPKAFFNVDSAAELAVSMTKIGDEAIHKALSLSDTFAQAAMEFTEFRLNFQNGQLPKDAHTQPDIKQTNGYKHTLNNELINFMGKRAELIIDINHKNQESIAVLSIYRKSPSQHFSSVNDRVIAKFDDLNINVFQDSSWMVYDKNLSLLTMVKPFSKTHWTIERAFSDAEAIVSTIMSSERGRS